MSEEKKCDSYVPFRMLAGIRFNKPINTKLYDIVPGGYDMTMKGFAFGFDFENYIGNVNSDNCILDIECNNPDVDQFDDICKITEEHLQNVEKINEFFVYIEQLHAGDDKGELIPTKIEYIIFELPGGKSIRVSNDVVSCAALGYEFIEYKQ